jgi:hypothetical protein
MDDESMRFIRYIIRYVINKVRKNVVIIADRISYEFLQNDNIDPIELIFRRRPFFLLLRIYFLPLQSRDGIVVALFPTKPSQFTIRCFIILRKKLNYLYNTISVSTKLFEMEQGKLSEQIDIVGPRLLQSHQCFGVLK